MHLKNILLPIILGFLLLAGLTNCKDTSSENKATPDRETVVEQSNNNQHVIKSIDTLKYCIHDGGLGAGGYDLVNYFTENSAELGTPTHSSIIDGVTFHFKSKENKKVFEEDPKKYLPVYGGWCSMTLAMGRATQPTYDNFKIIDGRLHLFERTLSINGQTLWVSDPEANSLLADKNYKDYLDDGEIGS